MNIPSGINEELLTKAITEFHEEIELHSGVISSPMTIVKEDFHCFMTENRVMVIGRTVEDGAEYPWYATYPWLIVDLDIVDDTIEEIKPRMGYISKDRILTYQSHQDFTDVSDYGRMVLSTFMI